MKAKWLVRRLQNGLLDIADPWLASWRVHRFGSAHLATARAESLALGTGGGFVGLFWHQSSVMIGGCHQDMGLSALVSRHRDGGFLGDFLLRRGIRPVRGSKSKGGAAASAALLTRLRAGFPVVSSIDGPRGPFKQPQPGIIDLARRAQVPIILVAARASREVCFRGAWDRMRLALPRAHVAVCYGPPLWFPPDEPDATEQHRRVRQVATLLHDLEQDAGRRVGRFNGLPRPQDLAWMNL